MPSLGDDSLFKWEPAAWSDAAQIIQRIAALGDLPPEGSIPGLQVLVARLPFYSRFRLFWFQRDAGNNHHLNFFLLHSEALAIVLDGTSPPIHIANDFEKLDLPTELRDDYLRFFMFFVRGDDRCFALLEDDSLLVRPQDAEALDVYNRLHASLRPLQPLSVDARGNVLYWGLVDFEGNVYACTISVSASGEVEMLEDEKVFDEFPPGIVRPMLRLSDPGLVLGVGGQGGGTVPPHTGGPASVGPAGGPNSNPQSDREVTRRFVAVLLQHALHPVRRHTLLERFNPLANKIYPIAPLSRFVVESWPVIVIESEQPFIEETIAELLAASAPGPNPMQIVRGSTDGEGSRLQLDRSFPDNALVLIPLHAYRSVVDVEWVAHEIAVREVAALISCERLADVPEALRRAHDLHLKLPMVNEEIFRDQFRRIFSAPLPNRWRREGTHWVRYVVATDFHQAVKASLKPAAALRYLRQRVLDRLRQVDPQDGPGLSELHGLSEARQIADDLISDIQAARDGEIGWDAVDPGILLVGPPGAGKTTLARAIAKDCGTKFIAASAASWQSTGHLGDHIRAMRASFAEARRYAPSILFIDEIDSIGNRMNFSGNNAQYSTEVVNALLELIQGIDPAAPVFVIAATNHAERVDPALRRAGRLDRTVSIPYPNIDALSAIFDYYLAEHGGKGRLGPDVDTRALGALAFGLTGADVESFVRGAARRARKMRHPISQADLIAEVTKKPRSADGAIRLTDSDIRRVATHEAGHALVRFLGSSGGADITFVSIVPRADGTLGFVASVPAASVLVTRAQYLEKLQVFLAGRAAEELEYGANGVSTGAGGDSLDSDLAAATRVATTLVCHLAMAGNGQLLWSAEPSADQREEVARLLREAYAEVLGRLDNHRTHLSRLSNALIDRQELTGDELRQILGSLARHPDAAPS